MYEKEEMPEPVEGSPEGTVWPTILLARCSGLHNIIADRKNTVFQPGRSCDAGIRTT
jgi:hypothetical protein